LGTATLTKGKKKIFFEHFNINKELMAGMHILKETWTFQYQNVCW